MYFGNTSQYKAEAFIGGGGISGMSTAVQLNDLGISVVMAETAKELSGRARIRYVNGLPVNVCPNWFHDGVDNALLQWLHDRYTQPDKRKYDVDNVFGDFPAKFDLDTVSNVMTITKNGIFENEMRDATSTYLEMRARTLLTEGQDASVGWLAEGNKDAETYVRYGAPVWVGVGAYRYSWRERNDDPTGDGGLQPHVGVKAVLAPLEREVKDKIEVVQNCTISAVERDGSGYRMTGSKGQQFKTDCGLLTFSIPAFQRVQTNLPYAQESRKASSGIQNSYLNKIVVPLDHAFFTKTAKTIKPNTHIRILTTDPPVFAFARPMGQPFVILFVGGEQAQKVEYWTQRKIDAFVDQSMNKVPALSGYRKFIVDRSFVTTHIRKKNFGCSYSALEVGGKRPGGPLMLDDHFLYANADIVGTEHSAGTMAGAFRASVMAAERMAAMCRPG